MELDAPILVAGASGLIGSALTKRLTSDGFVNVKIPTHAQLDLTENIAVEEYFEMTKPEYVVLAAGKVGGILENVESPADFLTSNLSIQLNVIRTAAHYGVKRFIMYGSSCMYPKGLDIAMTEDLLLSGHPEPTSIAYAVAKLSGVHMCLAYNKQLGEQRFIPVIPNSVFGANDDFSGISGHVVSSLITRFHKAAISGAEEVVIWGTGSPRREFVYADDVADASLFLLKADLTNIDLPINVGVGVDYTITQLAQIIAEIVGFGGSIIYDKSRPDGASRKLLNSSKLNSLGWVPKIDLREGLKRTYDWYLANLH